MQKQIEKEDGHQGDDEGNGSTKSEVSLIELDRLVVSMGSEVKGFRSGQLGVCDGGGVVKDKVAKSPTFSYSYKTRNILTRFIRSEKPCVWLLLQ